MIKFKRCINITLKDKETVVVPEGEIWKVTFLNRIFACGSIINVAYLIAPPGVEFSLDGYMSSTGHIVGIAFSFD